MPYLARLGITDCYLSPIWKARAGSAHGYDVCDPNVIDETIGGEAGFYELVQVLRAHQMGLILDIVPNHLSTDERENPWWRDVLRRGQRSDHAGFFDINWTPLKQELRGKVLVPILDRPYGDVLADGALVVASSPEGLVLQYEGHELPLETPAGAGPDEYNGTPGDAASFDRLHGLLEHQAYRLASWRTSADEVNYRRFFDVDELAGVCVERPEVFEATHRRLARLIASGAVSGVRVDHLDGLALPGQYCDDLQHLARGTSASGPTTALYTIVEKVLVGDEQCPDDWQVHGTTGYEFLNRLNGLFISARGAAHLERVYARFTGARIRFVDIAHASKRVVMETKFAGELDRLAAALNQLSERDPRTRDFTFRTLRRALVELVASLPIYRTYVGPSGCRAIDRERMAAAAGAADRRNPSIDSSVFEFIRDCVVLASAAHPERLAFALRFQQFTAPVFAKAVEDMAFYRDSTLVSLNEVGGDPAHPGTAVDAFHQANARRIRTPLTLSATATHDTKLGEDARARLNVLSDRVVVWQRYLTEWKRMTRTFQSRVGSGLAPDRHDIYRFYQVLAGIWPMGGTPDDAPVVAAGLVDRLSSYIIKSAREASRHTSWIRTNGEYEAALTRFVTRSLADRRFVASMATFVDGVARAGAVNSLAQALVKIAAPGVPDFYQGSEGWDLHLVDPDNRQRPDFAEASSLLHAIDTTVERAGDRRGWVRGLLDEPDGKSKLFLTATMLRFRRSHHRLFLEGSYEAIDTDMGGLSASLIAFARRLDDECMFVVTPRLCGGLVASGRWPLAEAWADARVTLPATSGSGRFRNVLTGAAVCPERVVQGRPAFRVADLLADFPVGAFASM